MVERQHYTIMRQIIFSDSNQLHIIKVNEFIGFSPRSFFLLCNDFYGKSNNTYLLNVLGKYTVTMGQSFFCIVYSECKDVAT